MRREVLQSLRVAGDAIESQLQAGLEDATGYHQRMKDLYDPGASFREIRQALTSMAGALRKIERGTVTPAAVSQLHGALEMIPPPWRIYLDQVGGDLFGFEDAARRMSPDHPEQVQATAGRMRAAVRVFMDDMSQPGTGRAKRSARRYAAGIQRLAKHYREAFPDRAISADPGCLFSEYVLIWLRDYMGEVMTDPARHIGFALEQMERQKTLPYSSG